MTLLKINEAWKVFGQGTVNEKFALQNLNLHILPGEFITVIGGNGAGKSTMLNIIAGVYTLEYGDIILNNKDLTFMPEYQRSHLMGRVFQDPMLGTAANMNIAENLALAYRRTKRRTLRWGLPKSEKDMYREVLKPLNLGLEDRLESKVGLLSGGQRQALTLLMATLEKPELLLLDEHTAALDPKTAAKVLDLTSTIVEREKLSTLMITHNMKDAIRLGNRLIMMHEGRIIYDVKGEEKQNLTTKDLMDKFEQVSKGEFANDKMLLI